MAACRYAISLLVLNWYLTPSLRSLVRYHVEHYAVVVVLTVAVLVEEERKNYWITNSSISVKVLQFLFQTYLTRDPFSKWRTSFWYCCHNFVWKLEWRCYLKDQKEHPLEFLEQTTHTQGGKEPHFRIHWQSWQIRWVLDKQYRKQ